MKCDKCGYEYQSGEYCPICGHRFESNSRPFACFDSANELTVKQAKDRVNQYPLPTAWYKFYIYFRFPIGFIVALYSLWQVFWFYQEYSWIEMPAIQGFSVFLEIAFLIFGVIVFSLSLKLNRRAYEWNIAYLIGTVITGAFSSVMETGISMPQATPLMYILGFLFSALIFSLAWFLPNFIYFKKRKSLFQPEFELNVQADKKDDQNAFEYNARLYDRKNFVKLIVQEACTQLDEEKISSQIECLKKDYPNSQNPQRCQALIEAYSIAYQLKLNRLLTFDEAYDKRHE